jgi:ribosome-associated toxin RatA of RatAB toxin-antitoxin module
MTKIETSVVIKAPLKKVFNFASDWRNIKRYFTYVHDIKPVSEKTTGLGAKFRLRIEFLRLMMNSDWECTEFIEKAGWSFNARLMGVTAVKKWRFSETDNSTRVTFSMKYNPSPPVIGQLADMLIIRRQWKKLYHQSFKELKRIMEEEKPATL